MLACDANLLTYDPNAFLAVVFRCRGRNVRLISTPLALTFLWSICVGTLFAIVPSLRSYVDDSELIAPLLTPVSFLLVFRLGRAAVRFWDARAAAGKIVEVCRTLSSTTIASCSFDSKLQADFARWTCAFPLAVKNFLRPAQRRGWDAESRLRKQRFEIGGLLSDAEASRAIQQLDGSNCAPIAVLTTLRCLAVRATSASAAPDRSAASAAALYKQAMTHIDVLTGAWGALERINTTPLPFTYVVHLRTFLLLYLAGWVVEAMAKHGWMALPVVLIASFALLGIEAASVECERPFRWEANHLALGKMCATVARNVGQTLEQCSAVDPVAATAPPARVAPEHAVAIEGGEEERA